MVSASRSHRNEKIHDRPTDDLVSRRLCASDTRAAGWCNMAPGPTQPARRCFGPQPEGANQGDRASAQSNGMAQAASRIIGDRLMRLRLVDFETTGMPPDARVCEVGWCDLVGRDADPTTGLMQWSIGEPQGLLVNPRCPMPPDARAIHHIGDADLV